MVLCTTSWHKVWGWHYAQKIAPLKGHNMWLLPLHTLESTATFVATTRGWLAYINM